MEQARHAHLCTLMSRMHHRRAGYPFGSLVDFATDAHGAPLLALSPLAIHTRNVLADSRCNLVVQMPGWSGLANARVTIFGDCEQIFDREAAEAADALKAMGFATTARTVWVWESKRMLPKRPLALFEKLTEKPPKTEPRREDVGRSFGNQMRQWRRKRGLNQREVLAILGEGGDQAKVSDWERGKMVPRNMGELLAKMEAAK